MNDFAKRHSGDDLFKKIMIASALSGFMFAIFMLTY